MSKPVEQSITAQGIRWATRATSIALEFALPPLLGSILDRRWGISPLLTIGGAAFGFLAGMIHLLAIARTESSPPPATGPRSKPPGPAASSSEEFHEPTGVG